jgi:thymidylate kinase
MKIVLAVEGVHGAGKSSVTRFIGELCEQHGRRYTRVGRRSGYSIPAVGRVTQLLGQEARHLTPQADIFLRLGREYQRAELAASAPPGVVVIERFALSILALARVHGLDVALLTPLLEDLIARADLHATIFVKCPFETAWGRLDQRLQSLASTIIRGEKILRPMVEFLEEEFSRGLLTGRQWLVENSTSLAEANEQVAAYLLPYL